MMMRIPESLLEEIRRHGERAYPAECCGVIAGRVEPVREAVRLFPMINQRIDDPHRYLIDPEQLRWLEPRIRAAGWEIIGYYHSHPDHSPVPSAYDMEHAWPWYGYLIVGVAQGQAKEVTAWALDEHEAAMKPLHLEVLSEV